MHFSAKKGYLEIVDALLKKGANVNAHDKDGFTPLHWAAFNGHVEIVNKLLENSEIEVDAKTTENNTPLHLAAEQGHVKVIEALIAKDADVNARNNENKTPLELAKDQEIINIFERHSRSLVDLEVNSQNGEEEASNQIEQNQQHKFNKRQGTSGISGQLYEIELSMLFLLQGITKKEDKKIDSFHLATNMEEAGDFDDVVFKYKYKEGGLEKSKVIFLQAKHKEKPENTKEKITISRLLSESDKKEDFSLKDYFRSYRKIKQQFAKAKVDPIFGGKFEDSDFIIYTNAVFKENEVRDEQNIGEINIDQESVLNLEENKNYYQLVFGGDKDEKIRDVLKSSSECKKLAKELAGSIFSANGINVDNGILKSYHDSLAKEVIEKGKGKLRDSFLSDENNSQFKQAFFEEIKKKEEFVGKSLDELKSELSSKNIKLPNNFGNVKEKDPKPPLPSDLVDESEIKEFLSKLKLFVGQPNQNKLGKIIRDTIQSRYKVTAQGDIDTIFSKVNKRIEGWWKEEKNSYYLTEKYDYFGEEKRYLDHLKRPPAEKLPEHWQTPIKNDNFVGRESLLDNINERLSTNNIATLVACHGLGGVGKTQLALEFIWSNNQKYKGVIWFDAKDKNTLMNDYIKLGRELNIIRDDEEKVPEEDRAKRVKHWLEDSKRSGWLLVCDNAPNYKDIAELLPTKGGKILLTSRYESGWPQAQNTISVNVFELEESRIYIRRILEIEGQKLDITQVDKLAGTLGHLPLGLAQASSYIKKTGMKISEYLKLYDEKKQALFSSKSLLETFPAGSNRETAAIVYVTWDITIEAIKKESSLAADWLTTCAYLGNTAIPKSLLEIFADNSKNYNEPHKLDQKKMVNPS